MIVEKALVGFVVKDIEGAKIEENEGCKWLWQ